MPPYPSPLSSSQQPIRGRGSVVPLVAVDRKRTGDQDIFMTQGQNKVPSELVLFHRQCGIDKKRPIRTITNRAHGVKSGILQCQPGRLLHKAGTWIQTWLGMYGTNSCWSMPYFELRTSAANLSKTDAFNFTGSDEFRAAQRRARGVTEAIAVERIICKAHIVPRTNLSVQDRRPTGGQKPLNLEYIETNMEPTQISANIH
ncbi:hypothetical protein GGX14DRAFT_407613 [Mycena pura]|uniref:Uncharacterized protein n=1 Tax=Mycena pura TaxID=153505 RepID=A0AAD6XYJ7_9AGAR|nr:hypothetical protein GGX14DRAFT_407613 [Mycena pura]